MATNSKQIRDCIRPIPSVHAGVITSMPLDGLRDLRRLTQVQMAQLLKISQGAVSKVERRNDMFVSTLRNYIRAAGGDLEIRAVFPEGDVLIDQLGGAHLTDPCPPAVVEPHGELHGKLP